MKIASFIAEFVCDWLCGAVIAVALIPVAIVLGPAIIGGRAAARYKERQFAKSLTAYLREHGRPE